MITSILLGVLAGSAIASIIYGLCNLIGYILGILIYMCGNIVKSIVRGLKYVFSRIFSTDYRLREAC